MEALTGKAAATVNASYSMSIFLVGWAVGGLTFGALGDNYGRARILSVCVLLYSLFTGLSAFSVGFWDFCFYRFITGLGVGGVFGLSVALVADSVPDHTRAPALGLLQSLSTWGNITAGLTGMGIGMLAARHLLPFGISSWQAMFLVGAIPAFLCVFIIGRLKEPKKWVDAKADGARRGIKFGSYSNLLRHPKWSKHAWLGLIMCSAGIIGLWGIGNFHPRIVRGIIDANLATQNVSANALGSEKAYWASLALLLQNIGGFIGMMVMAKIAQNYGRRIAFGISILCSFGSTVLVFTSLRSIGDIYWMIPLMGFGQLSVFAVYAIYLPELFPTSLRSTGTSFCYNFGRLAAATAPFTISKITQSLGGDTEAFRRGGIYVSFVLLTGLIVLPFLPETKDKPLPEE
jgi:MFS family permease